MREIKFRVWLPNKKRMVTSQGKISVSEGLAWIGNTRGGDQYQSKTAVLMQYTGLKDKNGVKIYEGDIVLIHNPRTGYVDNKPSVVERESYSFQPFASIESDMFYLKVGDYLKKLEIEVIGNIHQHPHLLADAA